MGARGLSSNRTVSGVSEHSGFGFPPLTVPMRMALRPVGILSHRFEPLRVGGLLVVLLLDPRLVGHTDPASLPKHRGAERRLLHESARPVCRRACRVSCKRAVNARMRC